MHPSSFVKEQKKHGWHTTHSHKKTGIILRVENLAVELGGEFILKHLDFVVHRGEFLVIVGPNGSGKSTLLKAMLGILSYGGRVSWKGHHSRISYLPEKLSPLKFREYPFTIREFFRYKNASDDKTLAVFDLVGLKLANILLRNPGELSAGQFQRMLIAWSIIDDPEVLIFDEPMSGIDIGGEETIYTLLRKLWKEKGLTIILVTHELSVVYAYATHVLCLSKEKFYYGKPSKILTQENLRKIYGPEIKFHIHNE